MATPSYRDRLKSAIVRVARDLLISDGLHGLQARRVASGAGCSVGTIYNLFGNLDMVVIAANSEALGDLHTQLVAAKESGRSVDDQLLALSHTYLDFAVARTHEWRAIFEHRFTSKTALPDWYLESQAELFSIVEDALEVTITARETRSEAARALFSAVHGVVALALDEKLSAFDRAATQRQVNFIVRSVARGLIA